MSKDYEKTLQLATLEAEFFVTYSGAILPGGRIDKAPINPKNGRPASNSRPTSWGSRKQAEAKAQELREGGTKAGIGLVLGQLISSHQTVGFDLDDALEGDGKLKGWARKIVAIANSYSEVSPSGRGLKIFALMLPDEINALRSAMGAKHKKEYKQGPHHGIEIHLSNSYFTITWQKLGVDPETLELVGTDHTLRVIPLNRVLEIVKLAEAFANEGRRKGNPGTCGRSGRPFEDIRAALFTIPNDGSIPENGERQWWLEIGMSLHHEFKGAAAGLELFQEWSAQWPGYDPGATETAWKSFRKED